jgi:hypothetical protein
MDFGPLVLALVALIGLGILVMMRGNKSGMTSKKAAKRSSYGSASLGKQDFALQWQRIETVMAQPGLESSRSAIVEADKLLDAALRQSGFRGETMGERLKSAREHFGNNVIYQGLWEAHKMRNALAHELGFDLPKSVAEQQLQKFKAGLQYLKVM